MPVPPTCPRCRQPLTPVGRFWICPEHGQVASLGVAPSGDPPPIGSQADDTRSHSPFPAPLRIFLSYGHDANEELVRHIKTDLEKRGHDVWFDKNDIKFGDDWRREITDGITGSHRVLSFLSKHSTRDPGVCLDEIAIAIGVKGGNIQTILVESETEVKPPASISHIQWLDMHDWKKRKESGADTPPEHPDSWETWYQTKLAEIIRVVESDESRRFAGEIETLAGHLKPIASDSRVSTLLRKGFIGRQWLFDAIETWRNPGSADPQIGSSEFAPNLQSQIPNLHSSTPSRLFWITGDPGVGKSAFAAHLTHFGRDKVIAAQFVEWDKPDHRDARRVVRSLAFQLATRLPDYRKLLLTLPEIAELDRKAPAELFDYLLANPLKTVIGGGRERLLIVIDALDEAGEAGRNPLVEMLARHAPRLPDWLGLVVTSRPESAVQTPLQGLNPFVLDTRTEANRADLRDFLRHQLAPQLQHRPDADRLIGQILEKSEGVFLYAERFCDDVQHGHLSLDRPEQFPQGLGGIYCQWFQRQFPDLEKFRKNIRPALRAILAAREPLPVEILQRLFNWQDEELRGFTRNLGSIFAVKREPGREVTKVNRAALADFVAFVSNRQKIDINDPSRPRLTSVISFTTEPSREVIKPYHKSLAEWLSAEHQSAPYFVSIREGHRMLGSFCASKWQSRDTFALDNLVYHLRSAEQYDELAQVVFAVPFHQAKSSGYVSSLSDLLFAEAGANGQIGLAAAGFALCEYVEQIQLKEVLRASGQWMHDEVADQACAIFALHVLESFQRDRPETSEAVAASRQNSWTTDWLALPESPQVVEALRDYLRTQRDPSVLLREREMLKPKVASARCTPRRSPEPVSPHTAHTAHFHEDYVENSLDAIDAALALEPGRLVMKLCAASQFKAACDCDGDPIWAFNCARGGAIREVNTKLAGLLCPLISFSSSDLRNFSAR